MYHYYDISTMISTGLKGEENLGDMPRVLIIEGRKF